MPGFIGIGEFLLLLWIALTLAALVSLARGRARGREALQAVWLALIVLVPVLGAALYLAVWRPMLRRRRGID